MTTVGGFKVALLACALLIPLAACTTSATPGPAAEQAQLGISNGTTLAVTLVVNGQRIADYPAGSGATIQLDALPALPWEVTALTASGRSLTSMQVAANSAGMPQGAPGGGTFGRVSLSCGRLTIWAGDSQPSGGAPPPSPGTPGDCAP
jgi:hypothetical protein